MNASSVVPSILKVVFMITATTGIVLVIIWARAFYGSMNSFEQAEALLSKGEYVRAISYYDRSLHWYAPFNPFVDKSAEMLWKISEQAQKDGDIRLAMIAVKTLRRGFVAARSFYVPGKVWVERCDDRVQALLMLQQHGDGDAPGKEMADSSVLESPEAKGPDVLWSLVLLAGFLGWIGSAMAFIISGRGGPQQVKWPEFARLKWMVLCVLFWFVWIVGMMKA